MKPKNVFFVFAIMVINSMLLGVSKGQNLEVEGQAKIANMPTDISADQLVVRQSDGTLAMRPASTLVQNPGSYGTVVNPVTGKIWLDRNLGAVQVATSSTDTLSYGDLFQWGRAADGHQRRTSATSNTQASTWLAGSGSNLWDSKFIIGFTDWLTPAATDLWSGTASENNPCPSGYRVPTNAEWNQERLTWTSNNAVGAFDSQLKLPLAGLRNSSDGMLIGVGTNAAYWSSTISGTDAAGLVFGAGGSNAGVTVDSKSFGLSIRCIKD